MQKIYSQAIIEFIHFAKSLAKQILRDEMGISVPRERISFNGYSYPLDIVVFEKASWYGYFDPNFFEIGLNKLFVYQKDDLLNTLRHELAHYICWLTYQDNTHGKNFRNLCKSYGWGKEVYEARKLVEQTQIDSLSSKIQKLLSLSNSSNPHEAHSALLKANQLLFKHPGAAPSGDFAVKRVLSGKRANPKWDAIATIVKTFGVHPVRSRGKNGSYLEVFGPTVNVATADYVAAFLDRELDCLFKETGLKGLPARHSFYAGIAKGYLARQEKHPQERALIKINTDHLWMAYPHLRHVQTSRRHSEKGHSAGIKAGANLTIRSPVESEHAKRFLT